MLTIAADGIQWGICVNNNFAGLKIPQTSDCSSVCGYKFWTSVATAGQCRISWWQQGINISKIPILDGLFPSYWLVKNRVRYCVKSLLQEWVDCLQKKEISKFRSCLERRNGKLEKTQEQGKHSNEKGEKKTVGIKNNGMVNLGCLDYRNWHIIGLLRVSDEFWLM